MEKARILIVEDEAIIAMEIESQLQSLEYEVTSIVDTGEKAIKKAEADKPDLILMDIRIKGEMDGIDAAEVIRNKYGIPVIFSTAYLDEERIERAKITMPFGYVLKPIQERDLKVTIEMALYVSKVDAERRKAENLVKFRLELEKMTNEISTSFVNTKGDKIDEVINFALKKTAEFASASRSSLFQVSDDLKIISNSNEWCANSTDSQIAQLQNIPFSTFGWHQEKLIENQTIAMSKLEDYPPEAKREREWMEKHGYRSLLFIPLFMQSQLKGTLGFFGEIGKEVIWSSEFIDMLKIVGNIILNALERKQAEDKLKQSEQLLREVINNMEKAIAVYEPVNNGEDFRFIDTNEFAERIMHYKTEDVIGKTIKELFPGESSVGIIEKLKETYMTGKSTTIPLKQYQDDRITQWVENYIFKLPSGKVVAMFEDTTEKRKAEE